MSNLSTFNIDPVLLENPFVFSGAILDLLPFVLYILSLVYLSFEMLDEARRRRPSPQTYWELVKESFQMLFAVKLALKFWVTVSHTLRAIFISMFNYVEFDKFSSETSVILLRTTMIMTHLALLTLVALAPLYVALKLRSHSEEGIGLREIAANMPVQRTELGTSSYYLRRPLTEKEAILGAMLLTRTHSAVTVDHGRRPRRIRVRRASS